MVLHSMRPVTFGFLLAFTVLAAIGPPAVLQASPAVVAPASELNVAIHNPNVAQEQVCVPPPADSRKHMYQVEIRVVVWKCPAALQ